MFSSPPVRGLKYYLFVTTVERWREFSPRKRWQHNGRSAVSTPLVRAADFMKTIHKIINCRFYGYQSTRGGGRVVVVWGLWWENLDTAFLRLFPENKLLTKPLFFFFFINLMWNSRLHQRQFLSTSAHARCRVVTNQWPTNLRVTPTYSTDKIAWRSFLTANKTKRKG